MPSPCSLKEKLEVGCQVGINSIGKYLPASLKHCPNFSVYFEHARESILRTHKRDFIYTVICGRGLPSTPTYTHTDK